MFTGFSLIPIAAKEMKNPGKMLPRAILTVMLATTAIFVLMQVVAMTVLGDHLAGSSLPVADIFNVILGRVGRTIIITGMMLSIIGVRLRHHLTHQLNWPRWPVNVGSCHVNSHV